MKRLLTVIFLIVALSLLVSCDGLAFKGNDDHKTTESKAESTLTSEESVVPDTVTAVYMKAQELGYTGTLEEFLALVKGKDGKDGRGVEDMVINDGGELVVTMTDGTEKNLGKVGASESVGLSEVRITEDKTFRVTLGNGIIIESAPFDVTFGGYVNGVAINSDGELSTYTSIDETVNYGKIEKIYVNDEGEIVVSFVSGDNLSFGKISGIAGSSCVHEYGEWAEGLTPTCTSVGYNKCVCSICGDEKIEIVAEKGHEYGDSHVVKKPSGYENGVVLTGCKLCGNTKMEFMDRFSEGLSYERTDKEEYRVTGVGECTDTEIVVPDIYEGLPVTEIGEKAFYDCDLVVSVKLPDTIVKVADKAFSECENLTEVAMPDAVEIGTDVFRGSINVEIIVRHKLTYVEAKDATCTEPGNIAYWWCEICNMYYEDEDQTVRLYDVIIPSTHSFVDGVCENCGAIKDELLIVSIETVGHVGDFQLGVLESNIGLPAKIDVTTADGLTHQIPVIWDISAVNKAVEGTYTITGILQAGDFYYDDGLSNSISATIGIKAVIEGTADIVFILDISGSMSDEISNVKNNIKTLSQTLYDQGVSVRFSAITYSDYLEYPSTAGEQTQIIMNGATGWFTDIDDYKTAIENIGIVNGGDTPEVAVDGLLHAKMSDSDEGALATRKDARVFYILLTDADYKTDNHYGTYSMQDVADMLAADSINTSVITSTTLYSEYSELTTTTGGINANIYDNFAQTLLDELVPIIYDEVVS